MHQRRLTVICFDFKDCFLYLAHCSLLHLSKFSSAEDRKLIIRVKVNPSWHTGPKEVLVQSCANCKLAKNGG